MFDYEQIKRAVSRILRDGTGTYDEDIHETYRAAYWEIKSRYTSLSPQRQLAFSTLAGKDIYTEDEHGRPLISLGALDYAFLELPGRAQIRRRLRRIEAEDALILRSVPAQPYYFDLFAGGIRLYPKPDGVYRICLTVGQILPSDADELFSAQFSDDFRQVFTLYCLFKICANITLETERAKIYGQQYAQEMERLNISYLNRLSSGRIRPCGLTQGFNYETE